MECVGAGGRRRMRSYCLMGSEFQFGKGSVTKVGDGDSCLRI